MARNGNVTATRRVTKQRIKYQESFGISGEKCLEGCYREAADWLRLKSTDPQTLLDLESVSSRPPFRTLTFCIAWSSQHCLVRATRTWVALQESTSWSHHLADWQWDETQPDPNWNGQGDFCESPPASSNTSARVGADTDTHSHAERDRASRFRVHAQPFLGFISLQEMIDSKKQCMINRH